VLLVRCGLENITRIASLRNWFHTLQCPPFWLSPSQAVINNSRMRNRSSKPTLHKSWTALLWSRWLITADVRGRVDLIRIAVRDHTPVRDACRRLIHGQAWRSILGLLRMVVQSRLPEMSSAPIQSAGGRP
jgi:hypothetical protein